MLSDAAAPAWTALAPAVAALPVAALPVAALPVAALAVTVLPGGPAPHRLTALHRHPGRPGVPRALPTVATSAFGALIGLLALGPAGALVGGGAAVVWRRNRAHTRRCRSASLTAAALADTLDRIGEEVRAGAHPAAALRGAAGAGPAGEVLRPAAAAAELGHGVAAALTAEAARRPAVAPGLRQVASAWTLAERHGVPLADLLAAVHADLRWRLAYTGRMQAALAGPRATAAVLAGLPVIGLALGELVGAGPLEVLRSGVLGQALVVAGAGLATAGAAWAQAIMRSAVPR